MKFKEDTGKIWRFNYLAFNKNQWIIIHRQ